MLKLSKTMTNEQIKEKAIASYKSALKNRGEFALKHFRNAFPEIEYLLDENLFRLGEYIFDYKSNYPDYYLIPETDYDFEIRDWEDLFHI